MSFQCISVDEAKKIIDDNNLTIIDIRDYNSFLQGHIDNAIHVENLDIDRYIVIMVIQVNQRPIFLYNTDLRKS
jgi:rhodanese-related sulfurtransferase